MTSEEYRSYLVECVKTAGQMIKDMAEDIIGETDHISDLSIDVRFDQENLRSVPEITIRRSHLPDFETLNRLFYIRDKCSRKEKK